MSSLVLKLINNGEDFIVRGKMDEEGIQLFSVFDFITVSCGYKDSGATARKEFVRLIREGSEHAEELVASCRYLKFNGKGQRETPCMTIRGLQRLLMILGGKVASEFRKIVEGTFTRVMAGDTSLIEVINANAASSAPIHQAYRQALAQEPVDPVLDDMVIANRKREREEMMFYMEMEERKQRLAESKLAHVRSSAEFLESLPTLRNVDERTKMQLEDYAKNTLLFRVGVDNGQVALSGNGSGGGLGTITNPTESLSVSTLVNELGYKHDNNQLKRIGKLIADKYRAQNNGQNPPQHKQYVNGLYIPVNSYMERDRQMMEGVIKEFMSTSCVP